MSDPESMVNIWPVFNEREATTVDHSIKQYNDESLPPLLESQGISCVLESGHPECILSRTVHIEGCYHLK